ncbi:Biotin/lipoate A/B protein ligase family protein [Rhizobiales bacterium GAS191]|nr:Biotin/lipoate A/B protein ligase family protein [Rhizobiales bacterium GAS191]
MPVQVQRRRRLPLSSGLDLPPPFRLATLREIGDAFAHAKAIAAEAGAGTLVHVGRFDLVEFAVVLEPEEPLAMARRALYAGLIALRSAVVMHMPPRRLITFAWPDAIHVDGALIGGARLAWPSEADEDRAPDWLVFGAVVHRIGAGEETFQLAGALENEGFEGPDSDELVGNCARHLMAVIDAWQANGFDTVIENYLAHLAHEAGSSPMIAGNGDLMVRRPGKRAPERHSLAEALAEPAWLDPATGGPRT